MNTVAKWTLILALAACGTAKPIRIDDGWEVMHCMDKGKRLLLVDRVQALEEALIACQQSK